MLGPFTSHESTNYPVSQDQIRNPTSSSTSNYYPLPDGNDQIYNFDIDDDLLDDNLLAMLNSPNYQDPSFSNFAASFDNELTPVLKEMTTSTMGAISSSGSINSTSIPPPINLRERMHVGSKIALRMKTEREIVDDGYRWRTYGKKKVKSSPNPRNYYRCWVVGCNVKKRVERDGDDSSYVITTYEGVHNHNHSAMIHYNSIHPRAREWNFGCP